MASQNLPLGKIYEEIDLSDFFILLLGRRYGKRPGAVEAKLIPGPPEVTKNFSYVRAEYAYALKHNKPILALLSDENLRKESEPPQSKEEADLQEEFRREVQTTSMTKTWRERAHIAAYVTSSLLDRIRPLESSKVVTTNADLITEVTSFLNTQERLNKPAKTALLIQYSSRNVRDVLRKLLWSHVRTSLYVVSRKFALEHQRPIVEDGLRALTNHLEPIDPTVTLKDVLSCLTIYRYDAPGSIRVINIDDKFLAVGAYAYMTKKRHGSRERLDIRGGELPMTIFHETHAGFQDLNRMVKGIIENWHAHNIVEQLPLRKIDQRF